MDKDYKDEVFASWMGAPLLVGNDTLGMLAVRHTEAYQYDEDDLLVLQILASQSAVAIQNFRLFTEKNNAEKLAMMSDISAEFVHRMNNLAGTIPSRAEQLRETLDSRGQIDHKILRDLDAIDKDARMILEAARKIKDATSHPVTKALMRVDDAIESALDRALAAQVSEDNFTIEKRISPELPLMLADPYRFVDVLTNIIKNGLDAIAEKGSGKLSVSASMGKLKNQPAIEISVEDEGVGISDTNLTRIFDLFYTTKKGGTGFGLWRDRFVVRELGGEILVRSKEGLGSTFKVLVPVEQPAALLN
jgi:signal transduction histidine kinase